MSYEERSVWAYLGSSSVCYVVYLAIVVPRVVHTPAAHVAYLLPLMVTTLASVFIAMVARSVLEVARPSDTSTADARDRDIAHFGQYASRWVIIGGAMIGFILAVRRVDYFWIANVIYLGFVLWAVVASVFRLVAYRRGL